MGHVLLSPGQGSGLLSPSAPKVRTLNLREKGRGYFPDTISTFGLPIVCLARPAITVLLLFIVYLIATFDYSLCRQKLVFVVLSLSQLPSATKNASGSLPAAYRVSELRDKLPSTPASTQHTGPANLFHIQQRDLKKRDRMISPGLSIHL